MKLFVIGNGFDLAHNLPTSYYDFRDYLEEVDWEFLYEFERLYGYYPESNTKLVKSSLWRDFESMLSQINESEMIDNATSMELGLEMGDIGIEDTMDAHWDEQYRFILKLNEYLREWISEIEIIGDPMMKIEHSIDNDRYISFNYTTVLEEIYKIEEYNVLHVHGSLVEGDEEPIIGHGDDHKISDAKDEAYSASEAYDEKLSSIMNALSNYYERTLKDVKFYISQNSTFFNSLAPSCEVYVIGCSFGDVDIPYFKKIKEKIDENAIWNIGYYDIKDMVIFKTVIMKIGVKEKFINMIHTSEIFT